jgi:hypothetical protein
LFWNHINRLRHQAEELCIFSASRSGYVVTAQTITPQLGLDSFNCPHCGAQAHQTWYKAYLIAYSRKQNPAVVNYDDLADFDASKFKDEETRKNFEDFRNRFKKRFLTYRTTEYSTHSSAEMVNLTLSHCYSCDGFGVWIGETLMCPAHNSEITPHEEMPDDIKDDFQEASDIVDRSPRGAAALLRLCIQKLMPSIGGKGDNLNDDIAKLVAEGLETEIQQALDVLRVIGNNAVHPGQIDLKDDKATALSLFALLNHIVERRIAAPKRIKELFAGLPPKAREAIEKRDAAEED